MRVIISEEDLDLVVRLGDYIYEGSASANVVRPHNSSEIFALTDYRNRYALYKSDPNLQAAKRRSRGSSPRTTTRWKIITPLQPP